MFVSCLECGTPLIGRSDKKFCDEHCRNLFNNRKNKVSTNLVRVVDFHLKKNRKILEQLAHSAVRTMSRGELLQQGFDPKYYTHVSALPGAHTCYHCYEYGFVWTDPQHLLLVEIPENA